MKRAKPVDGGSQKPDAIMMVMIMIEVIKGRLASVAPAPSASVRLMLVYKPYTPLAARDRPLHEKGAPLVQLARRRNRIGEHNHPSSSKQSLSAVFGY